MGMPTRTLSSAVALPILFVFLQLGLAGSYTSMSVITLSNAPFHAINNRGVVA